MMVANYFDIFPQKNGSIPRNSRFQVLLLSMTSLSPPPSVAEIIKGLRAQVADLRESGALSSDLAELQVRGLTARALLRPCLRPKARALNLCACCRSGACFHLESMWFGRCRKARG